ncbi:MAG: SpoIIE family protein phosphatase [Planctomycetes bacterium]|nr:SpoIIE family protein phosphatase [Planctomycetota bacterium]
MSLATKFTLGLGLTAFVIAFIAGFFLLQGAEGVLEDHANVAQTEMAVKTGEMMKLGANPGQISGRQVKAPSGVSVQTGKGAVKTSDGDKQVRIFQVEVQSNGDQPAQRQVIYAPVTQSTNANDELLILTILVCGGLVLGTIIFGAISARRVAQPLQAMVDDVLAISRGRLDRRVHAEGAVKEVAFLARAVDRMVRDLVVGQQTQKALDHRQREAESLRELRRNLQPLSSDAPYGFKVDTLVVEAAGGGTGDFVDSLLDDKNHNTLMVGSTANRGMPGALLMAMTRAYLRGWVLQGATPAAACVGTNASLNRDLAKGLYASAVVLKLDPVTATAELVSAGHKAPAVKWDAASGQLRKFQPNGIALGFDEGPIFKKSLEIVSVSLKPGDSIFLFSPGLFACKNPAGKTLGEAGVYALAKIAVELGLEAMAVKLRSYLNAEPEGDLAFALMSNINIE